MPSPTLTPLSSGPRVFPRIKFIWGSSDVVNARWRLGLFGFYDRSRGFPYSGLAISGRGLLRWTLGLGVAGYLGGAAVIARWFDRTPYNQIHYTDVLTWPARRGHVAELRGRAWLAQGKDALKAQRWAEGGFLLRKGLELAPDDFDARLVLAQFHLLSGQRTRAIALLTDGAVGRLPPTKWREQVFALAVAGEDWDSTLIFCDRCLAQLPPATAPGERQALLAHKLTAMIALGRGAEALALAEAEGDGAEAAVKVQRVQALLALGRAGEAAEFLARWLATMPAGSRPDLVRRRAQALREAGRLDDMDRTLTELHQMNPTRPEPLAFAVEQRTRAGRDAGAALDDYLFRFGNSAANLQLVAQPLAEIPDVPSLQRIVAVATEHGFPVRPLRVHLATALLRAGDWPALARLVGELAPAFAKTDADGRLWFDWIECLSGALSSPMPGSAEKLTAFMRGRAVSLEAHRLTVMALRRAGREGEARAVLAVSRQLYAESPWLRAQEAEVDRAMAVAVAAPRPPAAVTPPAAPAVATTWREFSAAVDEALTAGRWEAARQLLAGARITHPVPEWVAAHDADLTWREVRVALGLHDGPALRLSLRLYLNGSAVRAAEILKFARELHAAAAPDDALTLVKAVLEKSPDHPLAASLLAEWKPRPKR